MKKKINSRDKGACGERELARILREKGFVGSRRGEQFCGHNGDADVLGLPGHHIECKRVEALNIYEAVNQSKRECKLWEIPVVCHRKNNNEWLITMPMNYYIDNIILGKSLIEEGIKNE